MDIDLDPFQAGLDKATAEADKWEAEAGRKKATIEVDADTKEAQAQIAALGAEADKAKGERGDAAGGGGYGMLGLIGAAVALAPSLAPGIAAIGLFGSAALAGLAQAGIGLAAFMAVAKSDFTELQTAIQNGTKLKGPAGEAEDALKSFDKAWEQVKKDTAGPVFGVITKALKDAAGLLPEIEPLVVSVAHGLGVAVTDLDRFLSSPAFKQFLDMIEKDAVPDIDALTGALTNFLTGFINLIEGLNPVTQVLVDGMGTISKEFLTWSQNLKNGGIQEFFQYVKQYGPETVGLLSGLFNGLLSIARGLSPLIGPALAFLTTVTHAIGSLNIAPLAAALASVISVLGPVITLLSQLLNVIIPPLSDLIGVFTGSFIEPLITSIGQFLNPVLQHLSTFLQDLATPLSNVLASIANLVNPTGVSFLSTLLDNLLDAIDPLLGPLSGLVVALESIVDDGLTQLTPLLGPATTLLKDFVTVSIPVIKFLTDILANKAVATVLFDTALGLVAIKKAMEGYAAMVVIIEALTAALDLETIALKAMYIADGIAAVATALWAAATFVADTANAVLDAELWADPIVIIVMLIIAAIALLVVAIVEMIKHWGAIEHFFEGMGSLIKTVAVDMSHFFENLPIWVEHAFADAGKWLLSAGKLIIGGLFNGVKDGYVAVNNWLNGVDAKVEHFFSGALGWLLDAGKWVIQGFLKGMQDAWGDVEGWAGTAAGKIKSVFSSVLKFGSPSKVMYELGVWTTQGFHQGFQGEFEGKFLPYVKNAMGALTDATKIDLGGNTTITASVNATNSTTNTALRSLADHITTLQQQNAALADNIATALQPGLQQVADATTSAAQEQTDALNEGFDKSQQKATRQAITAVRTR